MPTSVGAPTAISLTGEDFASTAYTALGADKKLYYVESNIDGDPLVVSQLACLGGQAKDSPGVAETGDGTRAFFVTALNGTIYQRYVTPDSPYSSIGAFTPVNNAATTNGPAAVVSQDGQIHLFVRGTNGALYHGMRAGSGSWRFESLGGQITGAPTAIVDGSRILVAATAPTGAVYTITGTNFVWGPWTKIVNQVSGHPPTQVTTRSTPALTRNPNTGAITMYAANSTFGLFAISKPASAGFTGALWFRLDSVLPSDARIAAATDGTNSIVYARFLDRPSGQTLTAYTQFLAGSGAWSDYFIAPFTCFNCAPFGVGTAAAPTNRAARLGPGRGLMSGMPSTRRVLG